ncbi:MAG TPA: SRPBCC domain-containing protein [Nocardioides sp.]|nr:SRPBCC domain-containing protein [Nocardioides sp.]
MRFDGEQEVGAPVAHVWRALHDSTVLRAVIPGCTEMRPVGAGAFAATLQARVGPVADTYRGTFTIDDLHPGTDLHVRVDARGRCGRLELALGVALADGSRPGCSLLRYRAEARVGGLVSRLGTATLSVVGGHFTCGFFHDLDRTVRRGAATAPVTPTGPSPQLV